MYIYKSNFKTCLFIDNVAPDNVCFPVKLTTKTWANEISWSIGTCSSDQVYKNQKEYVKECCVLSGDYTLKCKDSYGDGWHGGSIEIYGKSYCDDFKSGREATATLKITSSPPQTGKLEDLNLKIELFTHIMCD